MKKSQKKKGPRKRIRLQSASKLWKTIETLVEQESGDQTNENHGKKELVERIEGMERCTPLIYIKPSACQSKLMQLMDSANNSNAPLMVKSLGAVVSKYKITKDVLKKYPKYLFFIIQAEYISRYKKNPLKLFEDAIIKDLKKKKLYDEALKMVNQDNKIVVPEYKEKKGLLCCCKREEIAFGGSIGIARHIPGFNDTLNRIAFVSDCGKLVTCDVNNEGKYTIKNLWSKKRDAKKSVAVITLCGRYVLALYFYKKVIEEDTYMVVVFQVWDVETGKCLKNFFSRIDGHPYGIKWRLSKKCIALTYFYQGQESRKGMQIWNMKTGALLEEVDFETDDSLTGLAYSPSGEYIAMMFENHRTKKIRIWNVQLGRWKAVSWNWSRRRLSFPSSAKDVASKVIEFSPCEKYIAVLEKDCVKICYIETGGCAEEIKFDGNLYESLLFSPRGRYIILAGEKISIFDLEKKGCKDIKVDEVPKNATVVFSLCGNYFALIKAGKKENGAAFKYSIWNANSGECKKELAAFEVSHCGMPLNSSIVLRKFI